MQKRTLQIGQHVKVVDEYGRLHDGLVTNQWGNGEVQDGTPGPAINVLYVVDDETRRDPYGNQIERLSSCSHKLSTTAPGRYWFFPDEQF
jgi:hypothetical protein